MHFQTYLGIISKINIGRRIRMNFNKLNLTFTLEKPFQEKCFKKGKLSLTLLLALSLPLAFTLADFKRYPEDTDI